MLSETDLTRRRDVLDVVTAEVVSVMIRRRILPILLKGPALARWLYDDTERYYGDIDLLIDLVDITGAERVLSEVGFTYIHEDSHSRVWRRERDDVVVELHFDLIGTGPASQPIYRTLSEGTELIQVGGADVQILSPPARAMHVALHAVQDGLYKQKPLEDLDRAVRKVSEKEWRAAVDVAERLDAVSAMSAGLRLTTAGAQLASELTLPTDQTMETMLRSLPRRDGLDGFVKLMNTHGIRARCKLLLSELFPTRQFMRATSPIANQGRVGLLLAYIARPGKLGWFFARGIWLIYRSRSEASATMVSSGEVARSGRERRIPGDE
jgi:hypothetical protein